MNTHSTTSNLSLDEQKQLLSLLEKLGMSGSTSDKVSDIILNFGREQLKNTILKEISQSTPFTNGQEGELYKISVGYKDFIIAKKRFSLGGKNETDLQKKSWEISKESSTGVKVPQIIDNFNSQGSDYLVMEFINGKTLYVLIWEAIINQIIIPNLKNKAQGDISIYLDIFTSKGENGVEFGDDTQAEKEIKDFLFEMHRNFGLCDNPYVLERDIGAPAYKTNPVMNKIYHDNMKKVSLFGKEEKEKQKSNISVFIEELNSQGIYHRDLGGNPRNIMFSKKSNGKYVPWIIDFGRGTENTSTGSIIWEDSLTGGRYDQDKAIVTYIDTVPAHEEIVKRRPEISQEELEGFYRTAIEDMHENKIRSLYPGAKMHTNSKDRLEKFFSELLSGDALLGGKELFIMKMIRNNESSKNTMTITEQHTSSEGYIGLILYLAIQSGFHTAITDFIYTLSKSRKNTKARLLYEKILSIYNKI